MGIAVANRPIFLPNLSVIKLKGKGPMTAPSVTKDPIQPSSSSVMGLPIGFIEVSLEESLGNIGDVHDNGISTDVAKKQAEKER